MNAYVIFADNEFLCNYSAKTFELSELVGWEVDNLSDSDEVREIEVYRNPTWVENDDPDYPGQFIAHWDEKTTWNARIVIDDDFVIVSVEEE